MLGETQHYTNSKLCEGSSFSPGIGGWGKGSGCLNEKSFVNSTTCLTSFKDASAHQDRGGLCFPVHSSAFQYILGHSSMFQCIPVCSSLFLQIRLPIPLYKLLLSELCGAWD